MAQDGGAGPVCAPPDGGLTGQGLTRTVEIIVTNLNREPEIKRFRSSLELPQGVLCLPNQCTLCMASSCVLKEGFPFMLAPEGSDPDSDTLTWSMTVSPEVTGAQPSIDESTGIITWIPDYDLVGSTDETSTFTFNITATDSGKPDSKSVNMSVNTLVRNVNRAPIINIEPNQDVFPTTIGTDNNTIRFTVTATDPDTGENLTVEMGSLSAPRSSQFHRDTGEFRYLPTYFHKGTYRVSFFATDGQKITKRSVTLDVKEAPTTDISVKWETLFSEDNRDLVVTPRALYVLNPYGLKVYDLSNPEKPALVPHGTRGLPGYARDLLYDGNRLYILENETVRIFSINDPLSPTELASLRLPDYQGDRLAKYGDALFVRAVSVRDLDYAWWGGTRIYQIDISNPAEPSISQTIFPQSWSIHPGYLGVARGRLFHSAGYGGVEVWNVDSAPARLETTLFPGSGVDVTQFFGIYEGYLYQLIDGLNGVLCVSSSSSLTPIGCIPLQNDQNCGHPMAVRGDLLYAATTTGWINIMDISTRNSPRDTETAFSVQRPNDSIEGGPSINEDIRQLAFQENSHLGYMALENGIAVVSIAEQPGGYPEARVTTTITPIQATIAAAMPNNGDVSYFIDSNLSLYTVNLVSPYEPGPVKANFKINSLAGYLDTINRDTLVHVAAAGQYLFLVHNETGPNLKVLDMENPQSPVAVSSLPLLDILDLEVYGDKLYVLSSTSLVQYSFTGGILAETARVTLDPMLMIDVSGSGTIKKSSSSVSISAAGVFVNIAKGKRFLRYDASLNLIGEVPGVTPWGMELFKQGDFAFYKALEPRILIVGERMLDKLRIYFLSLNATSNEIDKAAVTVYFDLYPWEVQVSDVVGIGPFIYLAIKDKGLILKIRLYEENGEIKAKTIGPFTTHGTPVRMFKHGSDIILADGYSVIGLDTISSTSDGGMPDGGVTTDGGMPDGGVTTDGGVPDGGTP